MTVIKMTEKDKKTKGETDKENITAQNINP